MIKPKKLNKKTCSIVLESKTICKLIIFSFWCLAANYTISANQRAILSVIFITKAGMNTKPQDWDDEQVKKQASYLQSGLWGELQEAIGLKPHFISGKDWSCLLIERKTPIGRYLFAPYGPTLDGLQALPACVDSIKQYARKAGFDWLTIEPYSPGADSTKIRELLKKSGAKVSDHNREPDLTRVLDLTPPPEAMLAQVSQSTRSFIRKNQREKFVSFQTSTDPADITIFTHMLSKITERKNVHFFPDEYFQKQAEVLMPAKMMFMELAVQAGRPVACALFYDYASMSSYTFAASLPEARKTSASALLLWQSMLNAKKRGNKTMDLYGIAPEGAPLSHPWAGFTSFKQKFGGEVIQHAGTWDIPLTRKYRLNRSVKSARKILKRH
jgi:lipid II:glycine glycyltransferase (peptidoglycan interpeptide bridge formation enzyme)